VEGTHHAIPVLNLSPDPEISAHMQTVCLEGMHLSIISPEHYYVLPGDIYVFNLPYLELISHHDVVPAVRVGREWAADVLLGEVALAGDQEVGAAVAKIVEEVAAGKEEAESGVQVGGEEFRNIGKLQR
jgi:hypothetical protein